MRAQIQGTTDRIEAFFRRMGMGPRLALTLLPLVLLPMLLLAVLTYNRSRELLQDQASEQMTSAAESQVQVLLDWALEREQRLQLGSQRSEVSENVERLIRFSPSSSVFQNAQEIVTSQLADLQSRQGEQQFTELLLVDRADASVLASTNDAWVGELVPLISEGGFSSTELQTLPVYDDALLAPGELAITTIVPVRTPGSETANALLIGVNSGARLGSLLEEMQIFWEQRGVYRVIRGNTYVLMEPDVLIERPQYSMVSEATSGVQHPVFSRVATEPSGIQEYENAENELMLAAYEWIPEWGLGVVAELPQADIFSEVNSLAPFIALIFIVAVALVAVIVPLVTRRTIQPLGDLTELAEDFAMGDLSSRVPTTREDEVGRLSRAFNQMAEDLSDLYRSLERRVEARTRQIRTASEVARDAVAIRDVESLLDETVNLITNRFGFYHAGVFLIDESGENAVLRAASSPGGQQMLARGHSIPVGKMGIVGYVSGTGKPRIASDVGADQVHMVNPDLPETRSEMALPLWSGDQIIGALDVQSTEPDAFDDEDVLVLQTMADQLAVAIENARLIEVLTELSSQNRQVIEVFNRLSALTGYDTILAESSKLIQESFDFNQVVVGLREGEEIIIHSAASGEDQAIPRLGIAVPLDRGPLGRAVTHSAPVSLSGQVDPGQPTRRSVRTTLSVPLLRRGTAIGAIAVETVVDGAQEERLIESLALVADQLAASLENARLIEETQRSLEQVDVLYRRQTAETWSELLSLMSRQESSLKSEYSGPRYPEAIEDGGDELELAIALRGKEIGRLEILGEKPGTWTEDERIVLENVAEEVANALEQMRLLEEIQRRVAQLQTAAEVAREASELTDLDSLLRQVVQLIQARFEYDHVAVFLNEQDRLIVREATGEVGARLKSARFEYPKDSESIVPTVVREGELYLSTNTLTDAHYQAYPMLSDVRSEIALPLTSGEDVIGVLDIRHHLVNAFTDDEISVMEILADQLSVAIQNARLYQETLRRAEREQMVLELTSEIRSTSNVDMMLQAAVRSMRETLGAHRARVQLFDEPSALRGNGQDGKSDETMDTIEPDSLTPPDDAGDHEETVG